jgi:hypothetical protein
LIKFIEGKIPRLKTLDSKHWDKGFTKSMIYRYVLLMYDPKSPIQEMHSLDWFGKKFEAVAYSGFKMTKGHDGYLRFDKKVFEMVMGQNDVIVDIIVNFISWVNNPKWNHRVYLEESVFQYTRGALAGDKEFAGAKATKEVREIRKEIASLDNEMARLNDETDEFKERFYYQIEQARNAIRPEDYAVAIAEGEKFQADSPYGINYAPSPIKFIGDELPKD